MLYRLIINIDMMVVSLSFVMNELEVDVNLLILFGIMLELLINFYKRSFFGESRLISFYNVLNFFVFFCGLNLGLFIVFGVLRFCQDFVNFDDDCFIILFIGDIMVVGGFMLGEKVS